jgi:branched-chain amino acid transport system permease protein
MRKRGDDLLGAYGPILLVAGILALLPFATASNTILNAMVLALLIALAGQGWNILGGYGGQFSFGHAAFFGTGAYATAILQARYGINAWAAFTAAIALGALVGLVIGYLSFRSGLRGSYFALVTLAFAEVMRIVANAAPVTNGAAGTLIKLDVRPDNFQFASRAVFFWIALALVTIVMVLTRVMERSRFGAWLVAVRENEDAARALGVDTLSVKLKAITLSAGITAVAGAFYAQYFLFVDATIAYGTWISVEALLVPIIGGLGTVFGPVVGAVALHTVSELTKTIAGRIPGIDLALYGTLLVLAVAFAPNGLHGLLGRFGSAVRPAPGRGSTGRRP